MPESTDKNASLLRTISNMDKLEGVEQPTLHPEPEPEPELKPTKSNILTRLTRLRSNVQDFFRREQNTPQPEETDTQDPEDAKLEESLPHPLLREVSDPEMSRRNVLKGIGIGFLGLAFQDVFKAIAMIDVKKKLEEDGEDLKQYQLLPFIMSEFGCAVANYYKEEHKYIFHPLDGFPSTDFSQQLTYIQKAAEYFKVGEQILLDPQKDKDLTKITEDKLEPGKILFLRTKKSKRYGNNVLSEAFVVTQDKKLISLYGRTEFNKELTLVDLRQNYAKVDVTEALIFDPAKLAAEQRAAKEISENTPLFESTPDTPSDEMSYVRLYGAPGGWGTGQDKVDGHAILTPSDYAQAVVHRLMVYEEKAGKPLNAVVDLIMLGGDGSNYINSNKMMIDPSDGVERLETAIVIREVKKKIAELNQKDGKNRKTRFSFNLRVPPMWTTKDKGRPENEIYEFIERFYTKNDPLTEDLRKETIDWSIDTELPGYTDRHHGNAQCLTTTGLGNIKRMIQHYSKDSRMGVYDLGQTTDENYIKHDGAPLDRDILLLWMGVLQFEEGVTELNNEMIDIKRESMMRLAKALSNGVDISSVEMMLTDPGLNPHYSQQPNDGIMTQVVFDKLTTPYEVSPGNKVPINVTLQ